MSYLTNRKNVMDVNKREYEEKELGGQVEKRASEDQS